MIVDSHTHVSSSSFDEDRTEVLVRAREAGVGAFVDVGCWGQAALREQSLALADAESDVFSSVGVHPHDIATMDAGSLAHCRALATHPKVVAIGETGLDFHYDHSPRAAQRESFVKFLELAGELGLPAIVHSRDADAETIDVLREVGWTKGVIHCFTGGQALADTALELGWYLGFTGIVTFKRATNVVDIFSNTPMERVLVETDAPYLAPVPRRGKRNEPAFLVHTLQRMAELRGQTTEEISEATTRNARALFGLPENILS